MVANINGIGSNGSSGPRNTGLELNAGSDKKEPLRSAKQSTVSLSDTAMQLKKLEGDIKSTSVVNNEKVQSIKDALKNGDYQIDFDRLASAFIKYEAEG